MTSGTWMMEDSHGEYSRILEYVPLILVEPHPNWWEQMAAPHLSLVVLEFSSC